jgi:hypothetical protein
MFKYMVYIVWRLIWQVLVLTVLVTSLSSPSPLHQPAKIERKADDYAIYLPSPRFSGFYRDACSGSNFPAIRSVFLFGYIPYGTMIL